MSKTVKNENSGPDRNGEKPAWETMDMDKSIRQDLSAAIEFLHAIQRNENLIGVLVSHFESVRQEIIKNMEKESKVPSGPNANVKD